MNGIDDLPSSPKPLQVILMDHVDWMDRRGAEELAANLARQASLGLGFKV